jgi:hypothetical protein
MRGQRLQKQGNGLLEMLTVIPEVGGNGVVASAGSVALAETLLVNIETVSTVPTASMKCRLGGIEAVLTLFM